jgi:hypothetical protein
MNRLPPSIMMKMLNIPAFGPTGNINSNNISSIGQGLKKIFNPQPEYPRIFRSDEDMDLGKQKRGSNSGVLAPSVNICPCGLLNLEIILSIFGADRGIENWKIINKKN